MADSNMAHFSHVINRLYTLWRGVSSWGHSSRFLAIKLHLAQRLLPMGAFTTT